MSFVTKLRGRVSAIAFLAFLLATPFYFSPLSAQTAGSGSITGTVSDSSNNPLASASILIRNNDTGQERTQTTNESGIYVAAFLQPGHYEVITSAQGFASVDQKNLNLQVGQTLTLNVTMPLQSVQSTVTVTDAPLLWTPRRRKSRKRSARN